MIAMILISTEQIKCFVLSLFQRVPGSSRLSLTIGFFVV